MGFWIFMFITSLIMPLMLIGFGVWMRKHPPGKINSIYGYRTKRSMKNMETWTFAHQYFGKRWVWVGTVQLPVSLLVMLMVIRQSETIVGIAGAILVTVQCITMLIPIVWTEKELHRRFG